MIHLTGSILGLAGVSHNENARVKKVARIIEPFMLILAFVIVLEWFLHVQQPSLNVFISDWLIWLFFLVETVVLASLADRPWYYLKTNWINLLIIAFSFPFIWQIFPHAASLRLLRLLVLLVLFIQSSHTLRYILSRNHLGTVLIVCFFIIVLSGTLISVIDPSIKTPVDGIWWAWVTVTTVGYGDIVPTSDIGRLFAAALILMGIGLFTLLTASFAAFFLSQENRHIQQEEDAHLKRMGQLEDRLMLLESKLDMLLTQEQHDKAKQNHANKKRHQ